MEKRQDVLLTHGDSLEKIGDNFKVIGRTPGNIVAAISNEKTRLYGVQFHPEVDLTTNGKTMLNNFLTGVCGLACLYRYFQSTFLIIFLSTSSLYSLQDRMTRATNTITEAVSGDSKVTGGYIARSRKEY